MTLKIIDHPKHFTTGIRILSMFRRNKDTEGGQTRAVTQRISMNPEDFQEKLLELIQLTTGVERIYVTAEPRNFELAVFEFKKKQLEMERMGQSEHFYMNTRSHWTKSLTKPSSSLKEDRVFLLDIDTDEDRDLVEEALDKHPAEVVYGYDTKSGYHLIIKPCNLGNTLNKDIVHRKNPMMLWAYFE